MSCGTWLLDTIHEAKAVDNKNKAEGEPPLYICPICGTENRTFVKYCSACDSCPEKDRLFTGAIKDPRKEKVNLLPLFIISGLILLLAFLIARSSGHSPVIFWGCVGIFGLVALAITLLTFIIIRIKEHAWRRKSLAIYDSPDETLDLLSQTPVPLVS